MTRHIAAAGQLRHLHGWRRQHTDVRDLKLAKVDHAILPPKAVIPVLPPVRDQGQIGSCTANAGCEAAGYLHMIAGKPDPMFSRLDLYAATRGLEGTPLSEDSGCQVRDVFKTMKKYGVCLESTWPYVEAQFTHHPPRAAVVEAMSHQAIKYLACDNLTALKHSIVDKYPVIGGFECYSSMFSPTVDTTGVIQVPTAKDSLEGGHCILFVGYDDDARLVQFLNSWGPNWGQAGCGFLPYDYFTNGLASDFWTLRTEEM
jgi:C1A family cysteine protease